MVSKQTLDFATNGRVFTTTGLDEYSTIARRLIQSCIKYLFDALPLFRGHRRPAISPRSAILPGDVAGRLAAGKPHALTPSSGVYDLRARGPDKRPPNGGSRHRRAPSTRQWRGGLSSLNWASSSMISDMCRHLVSKQSGSSFSSQCGFLARI